jgi:hypothetical protein
MEVFTSRKEIRRRLQARLGNTTNDTQAPLNQEQYNEFIRSAAMEVYSRCSWATAQRESYDSIGIDQRFINYPDGATGSNIIQMAVWDASANRYRPLRRARILIHKDDEPLVATGEPASIAGRGIPTQYEPKTQIEIWPRPDQAYQVKFDHTVNPDFASDEAVSVVDAECIILWATADAFDFQGDNTLAQVSRAKFEKRLGQLRAWSHTNEVFTRGRLGRLVANGAKIGDGVIVMPGGDRPNSGSWPSVKPS